MKARLLVVAVLAAMLAVAATTASGGTSKAQAGKIVVWLQNDAQNGWPEAVALANRSFKAQHPDALVAAHPECPEGILRHADHVGSTRSILNYATTAPGRTFLIATEEGIIHQMKKLAPDRTYIPVPPDNGCRCNECPFMKLNTLEKLYLCLRDERPEILLPEEIRKAAEKPLARQIAVITGGGSGIVAAGGQARGRGREPADEVGRDFHGEPVRALQRPAKAPRPMNSNDLFSKVMICPWVRSCAMPRWRMAY